MKVLLIGDSIRMFYQGEAIKNLGSDYEVYAPRENCRFSSYLLNSVRFYLDEFETPDIIHFNCGLWDTAILYKEDGCFIGIGEYVKNVKSILRELKKTGAKIIFATTTPVANEKANLIGPMPPAHKNSDIIKYNSAVLELLKNDDVIVNDLFLLLNDKKEEYLSEDMIHPNENGVKLLGKAVADCIKKCGYYKNEKSSIVNSNKIIRDEKTIQ
ncbi:MAG: SGNH/GDSL hydrolase family protein [Clostridiales bacterium]|nr:SGNH/GDSL hydrolase family protein [Clostridiales bacterium]